MADRCTLHLSKLDDFAAFAETRGFRRVPPRGGYEVLRLERVQKVPGKIGALVYYRRSGAMEHASAADNATAGMVQAYVGAKKRGKWPRKETSDG